LISRGYLDRFDLKKRKRIVHGWWICLAILKGGRWRRTFSPFSRQDLQRRSLFRTYATAGNGLIDFSRVHNPFCADNEKYTCLFASQENWLDISVRAGAIATEKGNKGESLRKTDPFPFRLDVKFSQSP